jgi:hypothetical protein
MHLEPSLFQPGTPPFLLVRFRGMTRNLRRKGCSGVDFSSLTDGLQILALPDDEPLPAQSART